MNWRDLGNRLASIGLRAAGGALAGPKGAEVAGRLGEALGVEPTPKAIEAALASDPDAAVKLLQIELDLAKQAIADVQHARKSNRSHPMTYVLPLLLIACWLGLITLLVLGQIPEVHREQYYFAVGALTGWVGSGIAYWMGTSRGSSEKQATLMERR